MEKQLALGERLLLMAIRPEKGGISSFSTAIDLVVAGAAFLEMTMAGNVCLTNGRVEILQMETRVPLYQYLLGKMAAAQNPRKIDHWLNSFRISMNKVKGEVYQSLVRRREIRMVERRFLCFRWKKPFLAPGNHVSQVIDKVKRELSQPGGSQEGIYLLLLLEPAGLLRRIYPDKVMRKSAKAKIRQFRENNLSSETVVQAICVVKAIHRAIAARRAARSAA